MKKNISIQVFTLLLVLLSLSAQASPPVQTLQEAQLTVREAQSICPELNCTTARAFVQKLSVDEIEALPEGTLHFLRVAAKGFAEQFWPDTVMESEYHVEFRPRVEALDLLLIDGEVFGYHLSFSSVAWNLHDCPVFTEAEVQEKGLANVIKEKCPRGRINDQAFVLSKIPGSFDDEMAFARFAQELK